MRKTRENRIKQIFGIIARCYRILDDDTKKYRHATIESRSAKLEHEEARMLVENFNESLPLKPGEANKLFMEVRKFIKEHGGENIEGA